MIIIKADTVAEWNRARFRRYWTRISSTRYPARPRVAAEIRWLIRTMALGRSCIHAEHIAAMDLLTAPTASLRLLFGFFVIEGRVDSRF